VHRPDRQDRGFERFGIELHIMTVAKGLAWGIPVAAAVSDKRIIARQAAGLPRGAKGAEVVGLTAAHVMLEAMPDERHPEQAEAVGCDLVNGLRAI
jgi:4-aminobutyrate aminotransferase-like enzyme